MIDLKSKSIMSSCCTNLPDQSVRNFGSRKPVGLYSLQVACDEKGYVVVGSCTNMALSVFIEGAGQLSVLHTFKINDYYVTSSMCLDDGLVLLCCQTKNFLVADYRKGVVLKIQRKEEEDPHSPPSMVISLCLTTRYIACTVARTADDTPHLVVYDIFMGQAQTRDLEPSSGSNSQAEEGSNADSAFDSDTSSGSGSGSGSESDNFAMRMSVPFWQHPITDFFNSTHAGVEPNKSVPEIRLRVDNAGFYNSIYLLY